MAEYLCEEDMNTGEYISRDLALKQLNATCLATDCDNYNGVRCKACAYADAMDFIDAIPAADVQPIKHGRWYHNTSKYISELDAYFIQACCSCCDRYSDRVDSYSQLMSNEHCSHCGARMDGDTNG